MSDSHPRPGGLFGALFSRLLRHDPEPQAQAASPLEAAERGLDALLKEVEARIHEDEPGEGPGEPRAAQAATTQRTVEEIALEEREASRGRMEEDVVALHATLGSGLTRSDMESLSAWARSHARALAVPAGASVEERIDGQVLRELYERAGVLAWERLDELMRRAGHPWPIPGDLALGRSSEELGAVLVQRRRELEKAFVATPATLLAALVRGDIPAWSHYYPDSTSALWEEVALRGVAACLRLDLFRAMLDRWSDRPADLEERIAEVLACELRQARTLVDDGVRCLDDARRVAEEVDRACNLVIPDMVWDYLGCLLRRERNYPGAPSLARPGATRKIKRP